MQREAEQITQGRDRPGGARCPGPAPGRGGLGLRRRTEGPDRAGSRDRRRRRRWARRRLGSQDHQASRWSRRSSSRSSSPTTARATRSAPSKLNQTADVDGMVQEAIDRSREGDHPRSRHPLRQRRRCEREPRAAGQVRQEGGQGLRQPARRARSTRSRWTPPWSPDGSRLAKRAGEAGRRRGQGADDGRDQRRRPIAGPRPAGAGRRQDDEARGHHEGPAAAPTRATSTSTGAASRCGSTTT